MIDDPTINIYWRLTWKDINTDPIPLVSNKYAETCSEIFFGPVLQSGHFNAPS